MHTVLLTAAEAQKVSVTLSFILMIALGVGIFVAVMSKRTTTTEVVVIGAFFLLLGATKLGVWFTDVLNSVGN